MQNGYNEKNTKAVDSCHSFSSSSQSSICDMSSNWLARGLVFWSFQSTTSRDSECLVTCAYPMSLGLTKQQSWNWLVRWVVGMMSTRMFWRISLRSILLGWLCNLFDGPRWRCCWWNCHGTLQSVEGWKDAWLKSGKTVVRSSKNTEGVARMIGEEKRKYWKMLMKVSDFE